MGRSETHASNSKAPSPEPWSVVRTTLAHSLRFLLRVVRRFFAHHGPLLASAVAFDALLSAVPLLALALVISSYAFDPAMVQSVIETQVEALLPGAIEPVLRAYSTVVAQRGTASALVVLVLVVFGTMAFRTIQEAMSVIFESTAPRKPMSLGSILAGLLYVALVGAGIFLGTVLMTVVDALSGRGFEVFGAELTFRPLFAVLATLISFVVLILLFASFYRFLPSPRPSLSLSLAGAVLAATLWEIVRRVTVWYFTHISLVGVIYGSLASVIVLLLSFEIAAIIVLLGGQFVAELDRSARAGLPWYREPKTRHTDSASN